MLAPDTLINNRYRIVRLIGQGGMGAVYEAFDERLSKSVALKQTIVSGTRLSRAFEREAQLLARLDHPSLISVTDYFFEEGDQFLVMEFVPGDDLHTLLSQRGEPFPIDTVLQWADQLLDVLEYLHSQEPPVIHRDIKPQNLKLNPQGRIILLDFGLAKGGEHQTETRSLLGYTPQYAPPEQIQSTGTDPRTDMYSLAATLYYLLLGEPPPNASTRSAAVISDQNDPLRPLHEISPRVSVEVSSLLTWALALNPARRPDNAHQMRASLQTIMQQRNKPQLTVQLEPADDTRRAPVWRWSMVGVVVVMLVGLLAFGGWMMRTSSMDNDKTQISMPPTSASAADDDEAREDEAISSTMRERTATAEAEETIEARARATAEAEATASTRAATATTQARATAGAEATATEQAAVIATATAAAQATRTAFNTVSTALLAEEAEREALHLSSELDNATSQYDPATGDSLLRNGYEANIVSIGGGQGLRPSHTERAFHTWVRDLDYAMSGYSYVLGDMRVLKQNTELFLRGVRETGTTPEVYNPESGFDNNGAWDSRPNLIHAVYAYVAKTGDRSFYREHRDTLSQVGEWIVSLDTNGDGLPDQGNVERYGYYNSIENSVMRTYAIAKFYAAYRELAELERAIGQDGGNWQARADQLRTSYNQPFDEGGYWREGQAWPLAWRTPDGQFEETLETFGVFEAIRGGLIRPTDERYPALVQSLHVVRPELMRGATPVRLAFGGYNPSLLRAGVESWKLDASAPWIVGLAVPVYASANYPDDAQILLQAYTQDAQRFDMLVRQLVAIDGSGDEGRGGAWASAAWFMAVYGGHYGLTMTPAALEIAPHPIADIPDDGIRNLSYHGAVLDMDIERDQQTYRLRTDRRTAAILRPMGAATLLSVNGSPLSEEARLILEPGEEYVVVSTSDEQE